MGRFQNDNTKVVVSVADDKDDRFALGWSSYTGEDASSDDSGSDDSGAPAGNASLEEWQEYAKSQGASEEDVADKSRNELRDQYGK